MTTEGKIRVAVLLAQLRRYVEESRDPDDAHLYHDMGTGADMACAFDELDELLYNDPATLPAEWWPRG